MFAQPGSFLTSDSILDGEVILDVRDATGEKHRITLGQRSYASIDQGRLYLDGAVVSPRSDLEDRLMTFLSSLSGTAEDNDARDDLVKFVRSDEYEMLSRITDDERRRRVLESLRAAAANFLSGPCCSPSDQVRPSAAELIQRFVDGESWDRSEVTRCLRYADAVAQRAVHATGPEADVGSFFAAAAAFLRRLQGAIDSMESEARGR